LFFKATGILYQFGIIYLWVVKHKRVRFSELGFPKGQRKRICLGVAIGILLFIFMGLIFGVPGFPVIFKSGYAFDAHFFAILFLQIIVYVVIGPPVEEIFYRGFMYQVLRQNWGITLALILISLHFGVMHLPGFIPSSLYYRGFVRFAQFFLIGIVFNILFQGTKNLWTPISAHSTYNLLVTFLS